MSLRLEISSTIWEAYRNDRRTIETLQFDEFVLVQSSFKLAVKAELGLLSTEEEQKLNQIQNSDLPAYRKSDLEGIVKSLRDMVMGEKEIRWGKAKREIEQLRRDRIAERALTIFPSTSDIAPASHFFRKDRSIRY